MSDSTTRLITARRVASDAGDLAHVTIAVGAVIEADCEPMLAEITEVARTLSPWLAIDFARLGHVSSAMLGTLIRVKSRAREAGGGLVLFSLPDEILKVITLTRLDAVFAIADDEEAALHRLASEAASNHG